MTNERGNGIVCGAIGIIIGLIVGIVLGATIATGIYTPQVADRDDEVAALKEEIEAYRLTFDSLGIGPRLKGKK